MGGVYPTGGEKKGATDWYRSPLEIIRRGRYRLNPDRKSEPARFAASATESRKSFAPSA